MKTKSCDKDTSPLSKSRIFKVRSLDPEMIYWSSEVNTQHQTLSGLCKVRTSSPVSNSQIFNVLSVDPETIKWSSEVNVHPRTEP